MADHAILAVVLARSTPFADVGAKGTPGESVIGVGTIASRTSRTCGRVTRMLAVFPDWAPPWVFIVGRALVDNRLESCGGKGVAPEAEVLNYPMVSGQECA